MSNQTLSLAQESSARALPLSSILGMPSAARAPRAPAPHWWAMLPLGCSAMPKSGMERLQQQIQPLPAHPWAGEGPYKPSPRAQRRRAQCGSQGARALRAIAHSSVQALLATEQRRSAQRTSSLSNPPTEPPALGPAQPLGVGSCWSSRRVPKGGIKGQGDIKPHKASHLPTRL